MAFIRLDSATHKRAKAAAALEGKTLRFYVNEAVEAALERSAAARDGHER